MGNPQQNLKYVHVGGTNGKGSTSLIIAGIMTAAGYRVGRFSSPHLHAYTERITIDSHEVSPKEFIRLLDRTALLVETILSRGGDRPTEFEVLTAMAFDYFFREKVDLVVMEVGMGGTFDSTNVITPLVSVITGVNYDHTAFLGKTLAEIAANKAGIIKPGIPVVIGEIQDEAMKVIKAQADSSGSPIIPIGNCKLSRLEQSLVAGQVINLCSKRYTMEKVTFSLLGDYQLHNLAVAINAVEVLASLGYRADETVIRHALASLSIPGRLEVLSYSPLVIADAAHNPEGAQALQESLHNLLPQRNKILLLGLVDDKDQDQVIKSLGDNTIQAIITRPSGPRGDSWQRVDKGWRQINPGIPVEAIEDITQAVRAGLDRVNSSEYLVITGSFYVLDQARRVFTNN